MGRGWLSLYRSKKHFSPKFQRAAFWRGKLEILAEKGKATSHLVLLANFHDGLARVTLLQRSRNWPRRPKAKKGKALVVITSLKVSLRLHCNQIGTFLSGTFLPGLSIWASVQWASGPTDGTGAVLSPVAHCWPAKERLLNPLVSPVTK